MCRLTDLEDEDEDDPEVILHVGSDIRDCDTAAPEHDHWDDIIAHAKLSDECFYV